MQNLNRIIMRGLALALALVPLLALALVLALVLRGTFDPQERQARALDLARQAQAAEALDRAGLAALVAAGWLVLPLALAGAAGALGLYITYQRWGRPAVVEAQLRVAALRAVHQPGQAPHTLTYSPSPRISGGAAPLQLEAPRDQAETPDGAGGVPTFEQLLARGELGRGRPLLLGLGDDGARLYGSWLDLYSTAVAGLSGSGKTTSQRFIAAQSALHGAGFVVADPQAGAGDDSLAATLDPLRGCYLCGAASTERAILDAVRYVAALGQARIAGRDSSRRPVVLWVDEATALLGHSAIGPELARLLEQIAQQYRKVGVYASVSGQLWTAERAGGTALRDSLASLLVHRLRANQARLLLPRGLARSAEALLVGRALLWRAGAAATVEIAIPNTTAADVRQVAQQLAGAPAPAVELVDHSTLGAERERPGSAPEAAPPGASAATPGAAALPPNVARALELYAGGVGLAEAVRQAWGLERSAGREYSAARDQVENALRERLRV